MYKSINLSHRFRRNHAAFIFWNRHVAMIHYSMLTPSMGQRDVEAITQNTIITNDHLTPEIKLHLVTKECKLWSAKIEDCPFTDPFWAFYWPGGQALSRYILDNPRAVESLRVLDIGCGSGATSIAAAMSNAATIVANDIDPMACLATRMNGELNDVRLNVSCKNVLFTDVDCDCLLVGDMFYDADIAARLLDWVSQLRARGINVLVGDPGRVERKRFERIAQPVAEYALLANTIDENRGHASATVWMVK